MKIKLFLFTIFSGIIFLILNNAYSQQFTEQTEISLTGVSHCSVAWGDYDNDGDLDILLTGGTENYDRISKIYRNNGDNSFTEQTEIGLTGVSGSSVSWGDYDNDGDLDILLTGHSSYWGDISKIYRNNGDNSFTEQTEIGLTGVTSSSVAWGDYDNDGDLDILLTGRPGIDTYYSMIYRNDSNNSFTEQTGINLCGVEQSSVAWGDYDNDGDLDILLTGKSGGYYSKIYCNNGNNSFTGQTEIGLTGVYNSSVAWGDYDNDGDLDILLTGFSGGYVSKIYRNNGDNSFTEQTGINLTGVYVSSVAWGDYDNDGNLDILLTGYTGSFSVSKIYRNNGDNSFTEQTGINLTGVSGSSVAWGDYDNDGDLDILLTGNSGNGFVTKIYRNNNITLNTVPSAPSGLTASITGHDVTFYWDKSNDSETPQNGLTYNLYVSTSPGGCQVKSPMADINSGYRYVPQLGNVNHCISHTVKDLLDGKYYWSVQAIDAVYAGGSWAAVDSFTINTNPPDNPQFLTATPSNQQITLRWDKSTEPDLHKYNIYRDTLSPASTLIDSVVASSPPDTFYVDDGLTNGQIYHYRITAVDIAGNESAYSEEASGIPTLQTITVKTDGTGDFTTIQSAIDASIHGDTVLVHPGTYVENINFNGKNIILGSIFLTTNDTSYISQTIIDGNQSSSVVKFENGESANTELIGFTIQSGSALKGGGIYCYNANPRIENCIITSNRTTGNNCKGGGIYVNGADTTMLIKDCLINDNSSESSGGGLLLYYSDPRIINVKIIGNSANCGGAMHIDNSKPIIIMSTITDNSTASSAAQSSTVLIHDYSYLTLRNTLIYNNNTNGYGGALNFDHYSNGEVINCTFAGNYAAHKGCAVYIERVAKATFVNTIMWDNTSGEGSEIDLGTINDSVFVSYCDVKGGYEGAGNIDCDPAFIDSADGDYKLSDLSPCIGAGTTENVPNTDMEENIRPNPSGSNPDMGAYENSRAEPLNTFSLVAYYPFNGNANDESENGNDGTVNGAIPANDRFGNPNSAFSFDGIDDYIATNLVPIYSNTESFTWEVTANFIETTGKTMTLLGFEKSYDGQINISVEHPTGEVVGYGRSDNYASDGGGHTLISQESYLNQGWHHYALVRDRDSLVYKFYVDGILADQETDKNNNDINADGQISLTLGAHHRNSEIISFYKGFIDDIRIYNRALTSEEIQSLYTENGWPPPVAPQSLTATPGNQQVTLRWRSNTESDLHKYNIYRDTSSPATTLIDSVVASSLPDTFYTDTGLANGRIYYYRITAVDNAGNESGYSSEVNTIPFLFDDIGAGLTGISETAVAWGDYDGDGDLDILATGATTPGQSGAFAKIYENNGGVFLDIGAPLTGVYHSATAWGDYDNDGDLDAVILGVTGPGKSSTIYRNDNGSFTDISASLIDVGSGSSVDWGDYDNDGDLDLILIGYLYYGDNTTKIYRNDNGNFSDISHTIPDMAFGTAKWYDYDNDGDLDIIINAIDENDNYDVKIYRNTNNIFAEVSTTLPGFRGSLDLGDYDNDGDLDILITGATSSGFNFISKIYQNDSGEFTDIFAPLSEIRGSAVWGDYDNDGDLDILMIGKDESDDHVALIYQNTNGSFTIVPSVLPDVDANSYFCTVWGDYDNDGDLDILLSGELTNGIRVCRIYRNNIETSNSVPGSPSNLQATVSESIVTLSWDAASDNETAADGLSYNLRIGTSNGGDEIVSSHANNSNGFRKIVSIGNVQKRSEWVINNLSDRKYYWSVQAIDAVYAGGSWATVDSFTINTNPPAIPQNLTATPGNQQVTLRWNQNTESDLHKYNIYRDTSSPATTLIDSCVASSPPDTFYVDDGLTNGQVYYYRVKAVDNAGNESDFSSEVSAIPNLIIPTFSNITSSSGTGGGSPYGEGVSFGDFNNDNLIDLYVATTTGADYLFKNNGNNSFSDIRSSSGIDANKRRSVALGDINNDGYLDIVLDYYSALYMNNGNETFTNITSSAGLPSTSVWGTFADFDNDGYLDIASRGLMYKNNGNNTFTDVTSQSGISFQGQTPVFIDLDLDGDLDLSIGGNDEFIIYMNDGNGVFTDITTSTGIPTSISNYESHSFGDINNDGYPDLYISKKGNNLFFRNDENNQFTDISNSSGAVNTGPDQGLGKGTRHTVFGDVNNDGYLDLYASNYKLSNDLYINNWDETFTKVTSTAGVGNSRAGHGAVFGDIDNDGDLDLYVSNSEGSNVLYENSGNNNNWIQVKLIGTVSNKAAIGARVNVVVNGYSQFREINGGFGDASQNDLRAHFGLSNSTYIDSIIIKWPSGIVWDTTNVTVNQFLTITETSISEDLVAYYPFNGNANDESENGNDGTVNGAIPANDRFGNPNSAFSFDGINDYIKINHNEVLDITTSITISAWVYVNNIDKQMRLVEKVELTGDPNNDNYSLHIHENNSLVFFGENSAGEDWDIKSLTKITNNRWYHFVGLRSNNNVKIYINNNLDTTITTTTEMSTNTSDVYIGACGLENRSYLDGKIDDIRIYNRALTSEEIQSLYTENGWTPPASPQNLTATPGNQQVTLRWNQNAESDLHKYNIYRDTSSPATTLIDSCVASSPPDTFYVDTGLTNGQIYYYRIKSIDNAGNESDYSDEVSAIPYGGPVWHIATTGNDTTGNGSFDYPFATIQHGIDVTSDGDTVLVNPGTYLENINFNGKNIIVGSLILTTGDTSNISQTIIDGNQNGSVVTFESGEDSTCTLCGFTITNGNYDFGGGGIRCRDSSPIISNSNISNNIGNDGGGIHCYNSFAVIKDNSISYNIGHMGGGIYCFCSSPEILNNIISNNSAVEGGASEPEGGGIYSDIGSSPYIFKNTIENNVSTFGGGIGTHQSSPHINSNIIKNNNSNSYGGGIYLYSKNTTGNPLITNNLIVGNSLASPLSTYDNGGGIYCTGNSSSTITNNTICNNSAKKGAGVVCWDDQFPSIINNIIFGNNGGSFYFGYSNPNLANNCTEGTFPSGGVDNGGNIYDNPIFVDTSANNYRLQITSPCINAGIDSIKIDDTWYYAHTIDIEGNPRPNPADSRPDMGAYESQFGTPVNNPPAWSVNPTEFDLSATVTAVLYLDYEETYNANDIIGVFVNSECRGVASPTYASDRWMYFVTIYSNTNGETMHFKAYIADEDTILDINETIEFHSSETYGNPESPFSLNAILDYDFPPAPPQNLTATPGNQQITLRWDANTESDLHKYNVYRGTLSPATTLIDSVVGSPPDTFYVDTDILNGQIYYYRIMAVDSIGNESGFSNEDSAKWELNVSINPMNLPEYSQSVEFDYQIKNSLDNPTDLICRYSIDNGNNWSDVSTDSDTTGITVDNYSGKLEWNSQADLPIDDILDLLFVITPSDNGILGKGDTVSIHLDNNKAPSVVISDLPGEQHDDIAINYQLSDAENDTLSIIAEYFDTNFESWKEASVTGKLDSIIESTYDGLVVWNSLLDLPESSKYVLFRIIPSDNDIGISDTVTILLDNLGVPVLSITSEFEGEYSGDIELLYTCQDDEGDTIRILPEYSLNSGTSWNVATITGDTILDADEYNAQLIWHSKTDAPGIDINTVQFRILPMDAHSGIPDETADFHLDNNDIPGVLIAEIPGVNTGDIPISYTLSDTEGDTLDIFAEYYDEETGLFKPATITGGITDLDSTGYAGMFVWNSREDIPNVTDTILFRLTPADNDTGYADTISVFVDNNVPSITLEDIEGEQTCGVMIHYTIDNDSLSVVSFHCEYSADGGNNWNIAAVNGDTSEIDFNSYIDSLIWNSMIDLNGLDLARVTFKITPYDISIGFADSTNAFNLDNNDIPVVDTLFTPVSEKTADIELQFIVTDAENDTLNYLMQYSKDSGNDWNAPSISFDYNDISVPEDTLSFIWHSDQDIPNLDINTVMFQVTPLDNDTGLAGRTGVFHVDNETGPIVIGNYPKEFALWQDTIIIDFDRRIDTTSLPGNVEVTGTRSGEISGKNLFSDNIQSLFFIPGNPFMAKEALSVKLGAGILDSLGKGLDGDKDGDPEGSPIDDFSWQFYSPYLGDYDNSNVVDVQDLIIFSEEWSQEDQNLLYEIGPALGELPYLDLDPDGVIDFEDFVTLARMWNYTVGLSKISTLFAENPDENNLAGAQQDIENTRSLAKIPAITEETRSVITSKYQSIKNKEPHIPMIYLNPIISQDPWNNSRNGGFEVEIKTDQYMKLKGSQIIFKYNRDLLRFDGFREAAEQSESMEKSLSKSLESQELNNIAVISMSSDKLILQHEDESAVLLDIVQMFGESEFVDENDNILILQFSAVKAGVSDIEYFYSAYGDDAELLDDGYESVQIDSKLLIPESFAIYQNYPNPFNPMTTIKYQIPIHSKVSVYIYDIQGRLVSELISKEHNPGYYSVKWNGKNRFEQMLSSGVYFYQIRAQSENKSYLKTKKMMILK